MQDKVSHILMVCLPLLFSLSFHEAAHAWMAKKRGDDTAYLQGRLTLNPLAHIDWLGTVILPIIMILFNGPLFGWAKPVPVDSRNLRHVRRDNLLIALAGPVSNLLLALSFTLLFRLLVGANGMMSATEGATGLTIFEPLFLMLYYSVALNLFLAFFNLLPLPALDGSHVLAGMLPEHYARKIDSYQQYSLIVFVLLLSTGLLRYLSIPVQIALSWLLGRAG